MISLIDDMLVGYASAQMMAWGFTAAVTAEVHVSALRIGSRLSIIASVTIAAVIAILVVIEVVRMRGWRALPAFDYFDPRILILSVSRADRESLDMSKTESVKIWEVCLWCGVQGVL